VTQYREAQSSNRRPAEDGCRSEDSEVDDLIVARDLGDGLDAVVALADGELKKVIVNSRQGRTTAETVQRLSHDLQKASQTIAMPNASPCTRRPRDRQRLPVGAILARSMSGIRKTSIETVPELLQLIDDAARVINHGAGRSADLCDAGNSGSPFQRDVLPSATGPEDKLITPESPTTQRLVHRQSIDAHYKDLHDYLKHATRTQSPPPDKMNPNETQPSAMPTSYFENHEAAPSSAHPVPTKQKIDFMPANMQVDPNIQPFQPIASVTPAAQPTPAAPPPIPPATPTPATPLVNEPTPLATPTPTPTPTEEPAKHHNPFHSWLNPFYHHTPNPQSQATLSQSRPTSPLTATPNVPAVPPVTHALEQVSTTVLTPLVDIRRNPNPYHHAPTAPRHANLVEGLVGPPAQVLERAMSMGKEKVAGQSMLDAASAERDLRTQRSAVSGGGRKSPMLGLM